MKYVVAVCAGLALIGAITLPQSIPAAERELLQDPHFQRGFVLLASPPGKRVASAELAGVDRSSKPVWDLAQWSSKHSVLPMHPEVLASGAVRYANAGKAVVIGPPSAKEADLALAVNASVEYGTRPREVGDPWVHLLPQQDIENPPRITELTACRLHVEARLNHSLLAVKEGYSPSRHAAQFQIFLTISNRRSGSPGFGQYLWFGIPLYDNRERLPSGHKAQDAGDTKMFIYTLAATDLTNESTHDQQWVTIDKDLLPHIRAALQHAWSHGFLTASQDFSDYRIGGAFVGWEVPGIFDVEMQIRNFSLIASP